MPAGAWLSILGGGLAVVASFLPWVTGTSALGVTVTRNAFQFGANYGFSVDGVVLVALGVIGAVIGIARLTKTAMPRYLQRSPIVLGLVVAAVAVNRIPSINDLVHSVNNACSGNCSATMAYGVYICFLGAAFMLIGGIVLRSRQP
jgi:hypothetical protein